MTEGWQWKAIEERNFASAEEFLHALNPSTRDWSGDNRLLNPWIYRGHGDAGWALSPTAHRGDLNIKLAAYWELASAESEDWVTRQQGVLKHRYPNADLPMQSLVQVAQVRLTELFAVEAFAQLAGELGWPLSLESDGPRLRYPVRVTPLRQLELYDDPPRGAAAVHARHHGMPSSLLDWTRKPYIAAFFAAREALSLMRKADSAEACRPLVVWAVRPGGFPSDYRISVHHAERHAQSCIHAQDGLFTWDAKASEDYVRYGAWPDMAKTLENDQERLRGPTLRKLTLPVGQASTLLRLLQLHRVSLAHVMPSFDNVAQTIKDWALYGLVE